MSIFYKIIPRINPRNPQAPKKFYAVAVRKETTTFERIAKLIAGKTSLDHTDALAVVRSMVDVVMDELSEGRAVQLGALGTLSVGLSSKGAESAEKFNVSDIKGSRINFRPGSDLTGTAKNFNFEKLA